VFDPNGANVSPVDDAAAVPDGSGETPERVDPTAVNNQGAAPLLMSPDTAPDGNSGEPLITTNSTTSELYPAPVVVIDDGIHDLAKSTAEAIPDSELASTPAVSRTLVKPKADTCTSASPSAGLRKHKKRTNRRAGGSTLGERLENKDPMETLSHDLSPEVYWILLRCCGHTEQQALLDAQPGPYHCIIGTMKIVDELIDRRAEFDGQTAALMAANDEASVKQRRALRQCLRTEVKRARKELYEKWFLDLPRKADPYSHTTIGYAVYSPLGVLARQHAAGATRWRSVEGGGRQLADEHDKIVRRPDPAFNANGKASE
jgi:hypothetical protein